MYNSYMIAFHQRRPYDVRLVYQQRDDRLAARLPLGQSELGYRADERIPVEQLVLGQRQLVQPLAGALMRNRRLTVKTSARKATVLAAVALVAVSTATLTVGLGNGDATSGHRYRLVRGDLVQVPALGWTCLAANGGASPIFTCTSDSKPIKSAAIGLHQIIVGVPHAPAAVHGGYRFDY
jgi:hypothetical protein